MERTNETSQGYTYGGVDYVYQTRYDSNGTPYQVAVPSGTQNPSAPPRKTPTVITSDAAKTAFDQANKTLDSATKVPPQRSNLPRENVFDSSNNQDFGDLSYYTDEAKNISNRFDAMLPSLDQQTASLVQQIKDTYARRIQQQQDLNRRIQGAMSSAGLSSGRTRYAPEIQTNIMGREEEDAINRITVLEKERDRLITEAEQAKEAKAREIVLDRMEKLRALDKERREAIKDLFNRQISLENLSISRSREAREKFKSQIEAEESIAENLAGGLNDFLNSQNLRGKDADEAIKNFADESGVSENFMRTALSSYRKQLSSSDPAIIKEYTWAKNNEGFKGTLSDYKLMNERLTRTARSLASGGKGDVVTAEEAEAFDLPRELIGLSERDVVRDLSLRRVPNWFRISQVRAGWIDEGADPAEWQRQWDQFRNNEDMRYMRSRIDTIKDAQVYRQNTQGGDDVEEGILAGQYGS